MFRCSCDGIEYCDSFSYKMFPQEVLRVTKDGLEFLESGLSFAEELNKHLPTDGGSLKNSDPNLPYSLRALKDLSIRVSYDLTRCVTKKTNPLLIGASPNPHTTVNLIPLFFRSSWIPRAPLTRISFTTRNTFSKISFTWSFGSTRSLNL